MFCKTRTVFFRQIARPGRSAKLSIRGSLRPERLHLSAVGRNDRQIAMPSAESGVHADRPGRNGQHFDQGKA